MTDCDLQEYNNVLNKAMLPDLGVILKVFLTVVSIIVAMCMILSLLAFSRTKRTPKVCRFLSCGLIVFDIFATLSFAIRRFIYDPVTAYQTQTLTLGWCFLSNLTVALLSLERFLLFRWPFFYLRNINSQTAKVVVFFTWCSYFVIFVTVIFSRCKNCKTAGCYTETVKMVVKVTYPFITFVSVTCFSKICFIVFKKKQDSTPGNEVKIYKSTISVLVCLLNFLAMALLFLIVTLTQTEIHIRWFASEILMTINGIVDTLVYVLWYKECRLEIVKMLSGMFPSLQRKSEKMSISIFNIVTYETEVHGTR